MRGEPNGSVCRLSGGQIPLRASTESTDAFLMLDAIHQRPTPRNESTGFPESRRAISPEGQDGWKPGGQPAATAAKSILAGPLEDPPAIRSPRRRGGAGSAALRTRAPSRFSD